MQHRLASPFTGAKHTAALPAASGDRLAVAARPIWPGHACPENSQCQLLHSQAAHHIGSVSCRALGGVLRHKTRPWRALMRQDEPDSTEQGARWYVGLQQQQRGMAQRAARRGMTQQQYQARMLQRVNSCGSYMGVEQRPASVLSMSSEWESLRQQGA